MILVAQYHQPPSTAAQSFWMYTEYMTPLDCLARSGARQKHQLARARQASCSCDSPTCHRRPISPESSSLQREGPTTASALAFKLVSTCPESRSPKSSPGKPGKIHQAYACSGPRARLRKRRTAQATMAGELCTYSPGTSPPPMSQLTHNSSGDVKPLPRGEARLWSPLPASRPRGRGCGDRRGSS